MRILLVEPDFDDNGALRVSLDRASRWSNLGADVTVLFVSGSDSGTRVQVPSGLRVVVASKARRSARWMLPSALARGWPLARKSNVIVAGREIASGPIIGALLAKITRHPFSITVHSNVEQALSKYGSPRHRRNIMSCFRDADLVVPVSRGLIPGLLEMGLAANKLQAVENGFDPGKLTALAAEPASVKLPSGPYIVAIGRLTTQKGFDLLLEAHAQALREGARKHHLVIVGEGPDRDELMKLIDKLGIRNSVILTGFLANPFPVLARADLFVLSSRWEGFPLSLAEALLLRVPTIATDCISGPREILDDGRFGKLVPVDEREPLVKAITHHLASSDILGERARAGSEFVRDRFDARRAAERHLRLLERAA